MSVQDLVTSAANRYGVDPNLALSVAKAESRLDPNALSSAGAVGVMQLMPSSFPGVNIYDTGTNVDAGVGYLAKLLNQYNGDTTLALAAYNAGPGNVNKYGGVPPFQETQDYIGRVMSWFQSTGSHGDSSVSGGTDNTSSDSVLPDSGTVDGSNVVLVVGLGIVSAWLLTEML